MKKVNKFLGQIQDLFGFGLDKTEELKKEAIEDIVKKLKKKELELKTQLKEAKSHEEKNEIKDSIIILQKQIKKGKKLI